MRGEVGESVLACGGGALGWRIVGCGGKCGRSEGKMWGEV